MGRPSRRHKKAKPPTRIEAWATMNREPLPPPEPKRARKPLIHGPTYRAQLIRAGLLKPAPVEDEPRREREAHEETREGYTQ